MTPQEMTPQEMFKQAHANPELFKRAEEISERELFNSTNPQPTPQQTNTEGVNSGNNPQISTSLPQPEQPFNIGNFIDEKVAVEFVDIGLPVLIGGMLKAFMNKKVPKSQLQASQSEKELMYAPMKEVLRTMQIKVTNPFEALVYAAICVYGSKTAVVCMDDSYTIPPKGKANFGMADDLNQLADNGEVKRKRGRPSKN
jgi:hypothetical protein